MPPQNGKPANQTKMSIPELKTLYPEECALIYEAGRYHEIYKLRRTEIKAAEARWHEREEQKRQARRRSRSARKLQPA
jgi:hypothetical protein